MSLQTWVETLIQQSVQGPALNTSTTPTSILPTSAKYVLPANFFNIGKMLRIKAFGNMSNIVTTPGTLTISVRFNTTPIVVFTSSAMQMNAVAKANLPWIAEILLCCRAIGTGTSANLMGGGTFQGESIVGSPLPAAGGSGGLVMPVTTPAVGTGFDSTVPNLVDLFAAFSISNASNNILTEMYTLEAMN